MSEKLVDLCIYVLGGVAELFVKHFVRGGEAEGLQPPDAAFSRRNKAQQIDRKTCGKAELLHVARKHRLLVLRTLGTEARILS